MKYKVIVNGTETLCDKVNIDGFDYYVGKLDIGIKDYFEVNGQILQCLTTREADDLAVSNDYPKVIATNDPFINVPKVVDKVEELANKFGYHDRHSDTLFREGLTKGYNKAKETHPYSEEDMSKFAEWITVNDFLQCADKLWSSNLMEYSGCLYTTEELLELWKSQRTITIHAS